MGKTVRVLMVGVVSLIPSGGNVIFADFETRRCQFCTKLPEMSDLCYLGKSRVLRLIFLLPVFSFRKFVKLLTRSKSRVLIL